MIIMEGMGVDRLLLKALRAKDFKLCPECGAAMIESDRAFENETTFVWYRCSSDSCTGQWLQKISQQPLNFSINDRFASTAQI
jgi:hypothetical protein